MNCSKIPLSIREAGIVLEKAYLAARKNHENPVAVKYYFCRMCGAYHVTKMRRYKGKEDKKRHERKKGKEVAAGGADRSKCAEKVHREPGDAEHPTQDGGPTKVLPVAEGRLQERGQG